MRLLSSLARAAHGRLLKSALKEHGNSAFTYKGQAIDVKRVGREQELSEPSGLLDLSEYRLDDLPQCRHTGSSD
jgi:hypothetical protein